MNKTLNNLSTLETLSTNALSTLEPFSTAIACCMAMADTTTNWIQVGPSNLPPGPRVLISSTNGDPLLDLPVKQSHTLTEH